MFWTSILVEQGRLFFKNQVIDQFGENKPTAYRGYRPCILDPLVLGDQIATRWRGSNAVEKKAIEEQALHAIRSFVSLAQKEVGRGRTVSADTQQGGRGIDLDWLIFQGTPGPSA